MTLSHARCPDCGALVRVVDGPLLAKHTYTIPVSRRAIPAAGGKGRAKRRCPGSGQPPRPGGTA